VVLLQPPNFVFKRSLALSIGFNSSVALRRQTRKLTTVVAEVFSAFPALHPLQNFIASKEESVVGVVARGHEVCLSAKGVQLLYQLNSLCSRICIPTTSR